MKELMQHGPIEVDFRVYEDFVSYKYGLYVMILSNVNNLRFFT